MDGPTPGFDAPVSRFLLAVNDLLIRSRLGCVPSPAADHAVTFLGSGRRKFLARLKQALFLTINLLLDMKKFSLGPLLLGLHAEVRRRFQGWRGFNPGCNGGLRRKATLHVAPHEFSCECDGCGRVFVPMPDSFILTGPVWVASPDDEGGMCATGHEEPLTSARLAGLSEFELNELGLSEGDRNALLAGNRVFTGADAFCPACLHELFQ